MVRCEAGVDNFFHFIVVSFSFYNVRWRACIVRSMCLGFLIGGEKGVVKHRVYVPSGGQL